MSLNQVAADRRNIFDVPFPVYIYFLWAFIAKIRQELRKNIFSRTNEDTVCMQHGFFRQRANMQAAKTNISAPHTVAIRQSIRAKRGSNINLDNYQFWFVRFIQLLHMLVLQINLVLC